MHVKIIRKSTRIYHYIMQGDSYVRALGSADKLYHDLVELDELRTKGTLGSVTDLPISQRKQHMPVIASQPQELQCHPLIGEMYVRIMRENRMKCKDVARFIESHIEGMKLGNAMRYVTALRQGYIYQSTERTGERVEDLTKYLKRAVYALRACKVTPNDPIFFELQRADSQFINFWNSNQRNNCITGKNTLEATIHQKISQ